MRKSHKTLGYSLKQKRLLVGLSQKQVADALGYSSSQMISNWERDQCHPPLSKLGQITSLYRIRSTELIGMMIRDYEKRLHTKVNFRSIQKKTRDGLHSNKKSSELPDATSQLFIRPTTDRKRTSRQKLALV